MHPNQLLAALREKLPRDAAIVADGGDFLSFARVGLPATTYLDPGSLGCIGVGTPFGIAASLALPGPHRRRRRPATARSASMRWRSTPRRATRRRC